MGATHQSGLRKLAFQRPTARPFLAKQGRRRLVLLLSSCRQEATGRDRILPQRGQADLRAAAECSHHKRRQRICHSFSKRFPNQRKPATQHDHLRMKQVCRMRQPESEVLGGLLENRRGGRVVLLERGQKVFGFALGVLPRKLAENAGRNRSPSACESWHPPPTPNTAPPQSFPACPGVYGRSLLRRAWPRGKPSR